MTVEIFAATELARRIRAAAERDALGHAVVLSGEGDLLTAARYLAAAMECEGEGKPCLRCGPCRKVLQGIHPDVTAVSDPDHKNIAVEILRNIRMDAYILPNEGRRRVYLFPDCSLLEPRAQNVLLKVLEEGPPQVAFLFCAANSASLLPTIRSRAEEWRLPPAEAPSGSDAGARELCGLLRGGKRAELVGWLMDLENRKCKREELQALLSSARDLLTAALAASYGGGDQLSRQLAEDLGRRRLAEVIGILEEYILRCGYNIGVGHLTGALASELAEGQRLRREHYSNPQ